MKNLKKALRLISLLLFLVLAATGIGIGSIFNTKERYADKEIRIELIKKKDGEEEDLDQVKPT